LEDVYDPARRLLLCELAINTDVLNPLVDFTPGHSTLIDLFLGPAEGSDPLSIPKEYFKVASAFAALGAVMKDSEQDKMLNPNHQRLGLQVMLKGAMEQLQVLAQNAQGSDKKVMEQAEAMVKDNEAWEAERSNFLEKVAASETQSLRMERESIKDTEADTKAVGTFSNHEQGWKNERVKLHTEIHGLQDEIAKIWHHSEIRATDSGSSCEDCIVKGSLLKELAGKLSTAEIDASELRKKLATVISNSVKHLAAVADATAKHEEMENKLVNATKEMEVMQRDLESAASAKRTQNTIIEELLSDVMTIQKDLIEKEEILAVTLTRASIDREEKHNLEKELVYAKRKRKAVEVEKERWKRLAEERRHTSSSGKDTDNRLRGMIKSKQEVAKRSELQRMHTQELQSVQSLYTEKLKALEHQLKTYENKVGLLENKVLVCSRQRKVGRHLLKEDEVPDVLNLKQTVNVHELVMLLESLEPDVSTIRTDGQTSEIQGVDLLANSLVMQFLFWNMATLFPLLHTRLCFRSQVEGP
jgi:chromosome segregation ATPase